ncbi:SDR family oxidoreductase [Pararhodospirillum oryzae]|uniref:Dehydrogenase n=1 Tax=Pararhodospirillum oryzae TaxID=478448 RepID=A0A512HB93_9PROT|nr:SDR family oxidoreductase [Pararhodospirillum oryzae]GEO82712.1 dehydrogenase [Pararhodospirillum oryzae]
MEEKQSLALVSGANRGIGLAIVAGLAREGVRVLMGCRDLARGEAACSPLREEGLSVCPVPLDITSETSVSNVAQLIAGEYGSLDILVNNAGIALDYDPSLPVVERMQRTLAVNVVGTVRLTEAMVPLLAGSAHPRIVNVSSELASFGLRGTPTWEYATTVMPTYQASKAAVNSLTLSYAGLLADRGIKVNAMCPGFTATEATNFTGSRSPEQAAVIALRLALLEDDGPTGTFANDQGRLPW